MKNQESTAKRLCRSRQGLLALLGWAVALATAGHFGAANAQKTAAASPGTRVAETGAQSALLSVANWPAWSKYAECLTPRSLPPLSWLSEATGAEGQGLLAEGLLDALSVQGGLRGFAAMPSPGLRPGRRRPHVPRPGNRICPSNPLPLWVDGMGGHLATRRMEATKPSSPTTGPAASATIQALPCWRSAAR